MGIKSKTNAWKRKTKAEQKGTHNNQQKAKTTQRKLQNKSKPKAKKRNLFCFFLFFLLFLVPFPFFWPMFLVRCSFTAAFSPCFCFFLNTTGFACFVLFLEKKAKNKRKQCEQKSESNAKTKRKKQTKSKDKKQEQSKKSEKKSNNKAETTKQTMTFICFFAFSFPFLSHLFCFSVSIYFGFVLHYFPN